MTTTLFELPTPAAESYTLDPHHVPNRADRMAETLERWHNDAHPGAFDFCGQQPCHAVNRVHTEAADHCDHEEYEYERHGAVDCGACGTTLTCKDCDPCLKPHAEPAAAAR